MIEGRECSIRAKLGGRVEERTKPIRLKSFRAMISYRKRASIQGTSSEQAGGSASRLRSIATDQPFWSLAPRSSRRGKQ